MAAQTADDDLLEAAIDSWYSLQLRQRMQGKSCFNFASVDTDEFEELEALTRRGFEAYQAASLL